MKAKPWIDEIPAIPPTEVFLGGKCAEDHRHNNASGKCIRWRDNNKCCKCFPRSFDLAATEEVPAHRVRLSGELTGDEQHAVNELVKLASKQAHKLIEERPVQELEETVKQTHTDIPLTQPAVAAPVEEEEKQEAAQPGVHFQPLQARETPPFPDIIERANETPIFGIWYDPDCDTVTMHFPRGATTSLLNMDSFVDSIHRVWEGM